MLDFINNEHYPLPIKIPCPLSDLGRPNAVELLGYTKINSGRLEIPNILQIQLTCYSILWQELWFYFI